MPVGGNFTALGGLAEGLAGRVLDAQRHERDQQDKARDLALQGILDSFRQGTVKDPNYAISYLLDLAKGKTPGKQGPSPLHPHIERTIGAIQQAQGQIGTPQVGQGAGQGQSGQTSGIGLQYPLDQGQQGGVPQILTPDEQFQRQFGYERAKSQADLQNKLDAVDYIKKRYPGISDALARRMAGFTFPGMTATIGRMKGSDILADDPNATDASGTPIRAESFYQARTEDGVPVYHPALAPVGMTDMDLEKRTTDFMAQGYSREDARAMASAQRLGERQSRAKTTAQRVTLNDLTIEARSRALQGRMTQPEALQLARQYAVSHPDVTLEDVPHLAQELFQRYGSGKAVAPAQAPDTGTGTAPAQTPAPAPTTKPPSVLDRIGGTAAFPRKLTVQQQNLVDQADTALQLTPTITTLIEGAGLQNAMGWTAGAKERWQNFLYSQGVSTDEFSRRLQQLTGAVQAYALNGLLRGRPQMMLTSIYLRHLPDASHDAPGLIYAKLQELTKILQTATSTTLRNSQLSPDQLATQLQKDYEAASTTGGGGTRDAALRVAARQYLLGLQQKKQLSAGVTIDDDVITKWLATTGGKAFQADWEKRNPAKK